MLPNSVELIKFHHKGDAIVKMNMFYSLLDKRFIEEASTESENVQQCSNMLVFNLVELCSKHKPPCISVFLHLSVLLR